MNIIEDCTRNLPRRNMHIAVTFVCLTLAVLACDLQMSMGSLAPDSQVQTYTLTGDENIWQAELTPGAKYKVELTIEKIIEGSSDDRVYLRVPAGESCDSCEDEVSITLAERQAALYFVAPADGKVSIIASLSGGSVDCTVQIEQVK